MMESVIPPIQENKYVTFFPEGPHTRSMSFVELIGITAVGSHAILR
jgi:hypothetical protein